MSGCSAMMFEVLGTLVVSSQNSSIKWCQVNILKEIEIMNLFFNIQNVYFHLITTSINDNPKPRKYASNNLNLK